MVDQGTQTDLGPECGVENYDREQGVCGRNSGGQISRPREPADAQIGDEDDKRKKKNASRSSGSHE